MLSPQPYPYAAASAHLYGWPASNETTVRGLLSSDRPSRGGAAGAGAPFVPEFVPGVFEMMPGGWERLPYNGEPDAKRTAHGDIRLQRPLDTLPERAP